MKPTFSLIRIATLMVGLCLPLAVHGEAAEAFSSRTSILAGPLMRGADGEISGGVTLGARYRLTRLDRPCPLSAEFGGLMPLGRKKVGDQEHVAFGSGVDTASLQLHFQMHLALITEL